LTVVGMTRKEKVPIGRIVTGNDHNMGRPCNKTCNTFMEYNDISFVYRLIINRFVITDVIIVIVIMYR